MCARSWRLAVRHLGNRTLMWSNWMIGSRWASGLAALWLGLVPSGSFAVSSVSSYRVEHFTAADGLDSESLMHVAKLRDGRIVLVGIGGEPRVFDGYRFTSPLDDPTAKTGLDGGFSSVEFSNGDLWIASQRNGLYRLRDNRIDRVELPNDGRPTLLARSFDGRTLLIPSSSGLFSIDALDPAPVPQQITATGEWLTCADTADGTRYVAGAEGLFRIEAGQPVPVHPLLSGVHVWSLSIDRRGRLMVATRGLGLIILDAGRIEQLSVEQGLPHNIVRAVTEVGDDLWLATAGGGLAKVGADRKVEVFSTANGLSSDTVTWITADEHGVLWAATAGAGLNKLWPSAFTTYADARGRRGGFHYALLKDASDTLWIGSNQGLSQLVDGIKTFVGAPGIGQAGTVIGLARAEDGLLVGARRGLYLYRPTDGFSPIAGDQQWNAPTMLHSPTLGTLIAQPTQVFRYDAGALHPLFAAGETAEADRRWPAPALLRTLQNDTEFGLLLGTSLGAYRSDGVRLWRLGPERAANGFWRDGPRLLIGGEQLGIWSEELFFEVQVRTDEGASATIYSIWGDSLGGVWLTTREGLLRIERGAVRAAKPGDSIAAVEFGLAEGLPSTEFEGGQQTLLPDGDGLLFVNTGGVTRLDPRQIGGVAPDGESPQPLALRIGAIEDDQRSYSAAAPLTLPAGTRRVALQFAALPAARSAAVRMRYRLAPVEANWRSDLGQRQAIYGGLRPGQYRFELQGEVAGVAAERAALSYEFEIAPRPIERLSVQLALTFGAIALLALLPTFHIRSLRAQRRRLIAEIAERTADLERLARTDGLTGLLNRRSFDEALAEVVQRPGGVGLILIDVDHFKKYNDHLGHQAGDACLKSVAQALSAAVAEFPEAYPRLVARVGGEEFAVLCAAHEEGTLIAHGEQLRQAVLGLKLPHPAAPEGVVTLSMGLALVRQREDGESALKRADEALYRAKAAGRNRAEVA